VARRAREKEVAQHANVAVPNQSGVLRGRNEGGREEPPRGWWWVSDEASDPLPPGEPQVTQPIPTSTAHRGGGDLADGSNGGWREGYARLYRDLWRPARTMIRRAFGSAFGDHEIEDLYGNAWVGTLRALEKRRDELTDEELRRYVLTAVANQASKELRRRGRRPTAPLELARGVADGSPLPDEEAAGHEESRVARDVLGTLPARRRAVMLLRYGWGLEPSEVCGLIKGLSHRAYRKEITRGVSEVSSKLRLVEQGRWCEDREPVLQAYAAGVADDEQRRQAEHHLAHCHQCTDYVGKLNTHLHEIGSSVAWTGVADAVGGDRVSVADRMGEVADRAKESALGVIGRGGSEPAESAAQVAAAGGTRGAGIGAAGGLAKLAAAGAAPKLVAACLGTGAAATACVAAGIAPVHLPDTSEGPRIERAASERAGRDASSPTPPTLPTQIGHEVPAPPEPSEGGGPSAQPADAPAPSPTPVPAPAPAPEPEPVAPAPPPAETVSDPALAAPAPTPSGSSGSATGGGGGTSGAVQQEFGGP
jgi:RNA polymerase sigma factor (sigma-70 family)